MPTARCWPDTSRRRSLTTWTRAPRCAGRLTAVPAASICAGPGGAGYPDRVPNVGSLCWNALLTWKCGTDMDRQPPPYRLVRRPARSVAAPPADRHDLDLSILDDPVDDVAPVGALGRLVVVDLGLGRDGTHGLEVKRDLVLAIPGLL